MKKISDIFKPTKATTFKPIENMQAQDYFAMIEKGEFPSFISSKDKERITELYNSGKTWDGVRKLQGIVESQNGGDKKKSFA